MATKNKPRPLTNAERQRKFRGRQNDQGMQRLELWIPTDKVDAVRAAVERVLGVKGDMTR